MFSENISLVVIFAMHIFVVSESLLLKLKNVQKYHYILLKQLQKYIILVYNSTLLRSKSFIVKPISNVRFQG
jgi:hypothetical protein